MVPAGGAWLCRDQGTWLWDRAGHSMQVTASATRQCEPQLLQQTGVGICLGQKSRTSARMQI